MSELLEVKPGMFVDTDKIAPEDVKAVATQYESDFPTLSAFKFYPYVTFPSLERAHYGILATRGNAGEDEVESVQAGSVGEIEDLAPSMGVEDALRLIETGQELTFEEYPFVEVNTKMDYDELVAAAAGLPNVPTQKPTRKDWSPISKKKPEGKWSAWEGVGVYDFRDSPPSRHAASVEEYQSAGMDAEATQIIDMMFQGDGWRWDLNILIDMLKDYHQ